MASEARKKTESAPKAAERQAEDEAEEVLPEPSADKADEGIRRALDAAQAANDAAQDMADLSSAHRAFAEAVIAGQKRNTQIATGAAIGAAVAMVLSGLVYFRSVEDLRIAAAVQADAAALLVEEVKQIDGIGDTVEAQQEKMQEELMASLHVVTTEIEDAARAAIAPPPSGEMEAQMATAIQDGVKADLDALRDELLQALAEADLSGPGGGLTSAEMTELLAGVRTLLGSSGGGGAVQAPAASGTGAAAEQTGQSAAPTPARNTKPRANPKTNEPNPFVYP